MIDKSKILGAFELENSQADFFQAFNILIDSLNEEANLNLVGRKAVEYQIKQHLRNRIDISKAFEKISKLEEGIIVIIRNPKKELSSRDEKNNKKNNTLKEYGIGAQILTDLGAKKIILLTSSSKKIVGIDGFGLEVNGTKRL